MFKTYLVIMVLLWCVPLSAALTFHSLLQHCQSVDDLSLQLLNLKSSIREKQNMKMDYWEIFVYD